jgi:hypothetical protein
MTREEIIGLAREAGFLVASASSWVAETEALERFAALVAAAEREACAAICDREARHYGKIPDLGHYQQGRGDGATSIEKKIRARGQE